MPKTRLSSDAIRRQFIDYFVDKHAHVNVPSSPVVPHDDPTLLFANAGMNQFKPYFLGTEQPAASRVVNTQKCIRAGGKHNDLDDVGKDTYHHTFFEMLGNWSFGDYFKAEAIDWAWDLLVNVWKLDPRRLHATYFEGDADEGLESDDVARDLWRQHLPDERIHPGNKKDNFWEMGDTGPCGPCSELHYDGTPDRTGGAQVNADDPRVIEIWNLVFIQFNRNTDGSLASLPAKHVDTGMGFERIVRVIQGKESNYDTDVFTPLFEAIEKVTGALPYTGELEKPQDIAYRVIADHIRTLTFALADGAHCDNEGRSYVLRSILRRAVRYGRQTLGVKGLFFHKLVPAVVDNFKDAFPELQGAQDSVASELRDEEEAFGKTLDRGIALFDQAAQGLTPGQPLAGEDAFKLHDTYGFPFSLTQLMAQERGLAVDQKGFEQCMAKARQISKAGQGNSDSRASLTELVQQQNLGATTFLGYDLTQVNQPVELRVFRLGNHCGNYKVTEKASCGKQVALVLNATPFYAESGGQVGDTGTIQLETGQQIKIENTVKVGEVVFHLGQILEGVLPDNVTVNATLCVDADRRQRIMANHTTTHVMNRALRCHVNPQADQKGSLVDDGKLRFDFSHHKAVTDEQLALVEQQVNADIQADLLVDIDRVPQEQALKINGLRAVFGEKYPPVVRVVSIGTRVVDLLADPDNTQWAKRSIEFCGGTHLPSTGSAQAFVILNEEAVGKGIRRMTALTGQAACHALEQGHQLIEQLSALEKIPPAELDAKLEPVTRILNDTILPLRIKRQAQIQLTALTQRIKEHQKAQGDKAQEQAIVKARQLADTLAGEVIVVKMDNLDSKTLAPAMEVIRKRHPQSAVLLGAARGGKVAFVAAVPKDKIALGLKAGDWVKQAAQVCGGGGGGRPDLAQAGGKDPSQIEAALQAGQAYADAFVSI